MYATNITPANFCVLQATGQLYACSGNCMLVVALVLSSKTWHYSHLFSLYTGIMVFGTNFLIPRYVKLHTVLGLLLRHFTKCTIFIIGFYKSSPFSECPLTRSSSKVESLSIHSASTTLYLFS